MQVGGHALTTGRRPRTRARRGREIYSHSRLSSFETCPRKFQLRYVLQVPSETESVEGFAGKRVHEVLERLYKAVQRGLVPTLPKVLSRFRQLWDAHYDEGRVTIVREGTGTGLYLKRGERCLENYYRRHYPFDRDETVGLEERVVFDLDAAGDYRMQGVVDRIARARDGAIEIHDFKTGQRVPRQDEIDRDRQLALYQIGVAERHASRRPIRLVWHYLSRDEIRTSSRDDRDLDALRSEIVSLIDRIRAERDFAPKPGPLCGWCEYRAFCPAVGGDEEAALALAARPEADAARAARAAPTPEPPGPRESGQLQLL